MDIKILEKTEEGYHRAYGLYFCPWCGDSYHEVLLEKYNHGTLPDATWFRLLPDYGPNGCNWTSFPTSDPSLIEADLMCPGCGGIYENLKENTHWYCDGKYYGTGNKGARLAKSVAVSKNRRFESDKPNQESDYDRGKAGSGADGESDSGADFGGINSWYELYDKPFEET